MILESWNVELEWVHSFLIQGLQGLSVHFNLAQTGRKEVAMSKLMMLSNSQIRNNSTGYVSFYVHIMYQPQ